MCTKLESYRREYSRSLRSGRPNLRIPRVCIHSPPSSSSDTGQRKGSVRRNWWVAVGTFFRLRAITRLRLPIPPQSLHHGHAQFRGRDDFGVGPIPLHVHQQLAGVVVCESEFEGADAIADMKLLDQLRPRLSRLTRLCERASDTDAALGNDIMTVALQAYGLLKLTGGVEGMESLRRDLSGMFSRGKRSAKADAPPEQKAA